MKKLIGILVIMVLVAGVCFAGAPGRAKPIGAVLLDGPPSESYTPPKADNAIVKNYYKTEKHYFENPVPDPIIGPAVGFLGFYPTFSMPINPHGLEGEIGYSNRMGDQSLLLKGSQEILKQKNKNTKIKAGLFLFVGASPDWGIFIEAEQYVAPNISIIGNISPVKTGKTTIWGDATVGGRFYLL